MPEIEYVYHDQEISVITEDSDRLVNQTAIVVVSMRNQCRLLVAQRAIVLFSIMECRVWRVPHNNALWVPRTYC